MNNITSLQAQVVAKDAEIESLRNSLMNLRTFVLDKGYRNDRGGYIQVEDVSSFCLQATSLADEAHSEAYANEVGPAIASGGCDWRGVRCTHEPSLRPNCYHCPKCAYLLTGEWNDTETKAAERMRQHWVANHKRETES